MGLDFYEYGIHWSYSGFDAFRKRLAESIGIDLDAMEGFQLGWMMRGHKEDSPMLPWKAVKDPIKYLLNHSDCDGELSPAKCRKVAPRLRAIINTWPKEYEYVHDRRMGLLLADAMDDCAKKSKPLEFQ